MSLQKVQVKSSLDLGMGWRIFILLAQKSLRISNISVYIYTLESKHRSLNPGKLFLSKLDPLRKNDFSDINYLSINLNSGLKITFLINPFTICLFKDAADVFKEMVQ